MSNDKRAEYLYEQNSTYTEETVYPPPEPGVYDYYGQIIKTNVKDRQDKNKVLNVELYFIVSVPGGVIEPGVSWWFGDNKVKPPKKESPRETNHRIAWREFSSWLRRITGIGLSDFDEKSQKVFKLGVHCNEFGRSFTYDGTTVDIPEVIGKFVHVTCTVSEQKGGGIRRDGKPFMNYEWRIVDILEEKECIELNAKKAKKQAVKIEEPEEDDYDEIDDYGFNDDGVDEDIPGEDDFQF